MIVRANVDACVSRYEGFIVIVVVDVGFFKLHRAAKDLPACRGIIKNKLYW